MNEVIISNKYLFEKKKSKFKQDSISNFHVVTDFDKTLTVAFNDGQKNVTPIAQIRNNNFLGEKYTKKAFDLFDKYHPIEIDHIKSVEEKIPFMQEWWLTHINLIANSGLTKEMVNKIIEIQKKYLRKGIQEFFSYLNKNEVPVLILSSGLGDIINGILDKYDFNSENIHVISNFFEFDNTGKAIGYKGKIVHVFNKDESQIKNTPYFEKIINKKNVLLLGDSLGDLKMTGQIDYSEVIKIGFLNENVENQLEEFKENFDIVLLGDGSIEPVNQLLKELFD